MKNCNILAGMGNDKVSFIIELHAAVRMMMVVVVVVVVVVVI